MRARFVGAAAAAAFSLFSGCAIHPVPEDVTGVSTYHIVRQIRCETREAIRHLTIGWLRKLAAAFPNHPRYQELVLQYESNPDSMAGLGTAFTGRGSQYANAQAVASLFYNAGIAYTFDLTMTENNDLDTELNFLKAMTVPVFTLGAKAGAHRSRQNHRVFTVTDTFSGLLKLTDLSRYCENHIVQIADYAYPITGRIGVDKTIRSFIELTLFGNLGGDPDNTPGIKGPPTLTDTLTFTTTLTASVNPKIVFTPLTNIFQPVDASLTAAVGRTDVHQVAIGLAIADTASVEALRTYLFSDGRAIARRGARIANNLVVGSRVIGGGTPSELLAVIAIDQVKSREVQLIPPP